MTNINKDNIAVILVNWNNWQDTCECLASLSESTYKNFKVIIIDNGSTDSSIEQIRKWSKGDIGFIVGPYASEVKKYERKLIVIDSESMDKLPYKGYDIVLLKTNENLGFAKACNVGIEFSFKNNFKYTFILNNDTTVDSQCLAYFIDEINKYDNYTVLTPIIYYYNDPKRIWYYGGGLTFTGRRNIYKQDAVDNGSLKTKKVDFVSGCAMFLNNEIFIKYGVYTEKYFFGQEDYEFSVRMKKYNVPIYAITNAKVYHKVGRSNKKMFFEDRLPYMFIGFLNRFVHQKDYSKNVICWKVWRLINLFYILPKLFIMNHISLKNVCLMAKYLINYSNQFDEVNKELFYQSKGLFLNKL